MTAGLPLTTIIIILAALILFVLAITLLFSRGYIRKQGKAHLGGKRKSLAVKEAKRRLSQNPKDSVALATLANAYFEEQDWENAFKTYHHLQDLPNTEQDSGEFSRILKFALSAIKLKNYNTAHKNFLIARSLKANDPQVNYNLGYLEYMKHNYKKAAGYLSEAQAADPESIPIRKYLGLSLLQIMRFSDAARLLSQIANLDPSDKEVAFALGETYQKMNKKEAAMKIFSTLKEDPLWGPKAALISGEKNLSTHQIKKAIFDLEIGLSHKDIESKTQKKLKYNLGLAYIKNQEIARGLNQLQELQGINPGYRDTEELIQKYSELNANKNLQTYLIADTSTFLNLCRHLCAAFFPQEQVKILDTASSTSEYTDILAEVAGSNWENTILFRFIRTTGDVGELILRDLHAKIKEVHATRALCITAGGFSTGARRFVEARLIDLIAKNKLHQKLEGLEAISASG